MQLLEKLHYHTLRACFACLIVWAVPSASHGQESAPKELTVLLKNLLKSDSTDLPLAQYKIGVWYAEQGIRGKAIEYLRAATDRSSSLQTDLRVNALSWMGRQYQSLKDYSNAIDVYEYLLSITPSNERLYFLPRLADIYQGNGQIDEAFELRKEQLQELQRRGEKPSKELLGKLGELSVEVGQHILAQSFFKQASAMAEDKVWKNRFQLSMAVAAVQGNRLNEAGQQLSSLSDPVELPSSKAYQELAYVHYCLGNYQKTLAYSQTALLPSSEGSQDIALKIDIYHMLKLTYEKLENYKQAVSFSQKYLSLENELKLLEEERRQKFLQEEVEATRTEGIIRDFIASQKAQDSELERARLEKEKKERELDLRDKELDLLKQQEALKSSRLKQQQLEREQIAQQLKYAEQEALAIARKQEAERLASKAKQQELLTAKAEADRARQEEALEAVQKEKALQEEVLEQEKSKQFYFYLLLGLVLLILLLLIRGYRLSKLAQRDLQQKSAEISRNNQKLLQVQAALKDEQAATKAQNEALARQQSFIHSSLNYAMNIQGAILPSNRLCHELFDGHFVVYRPKDVVSGDFYWLSDLPDGSRFVATIDCTGHGVPGAFMSMIGHTLLNELLLTKGQHRPAEVLENLHLKIQQALHQEETQNRDGMDVCACWLPSSKDENQQLLYYSGARIPLYYYHKDLGFNRIAPTKRSLGGEMRLKRDFEEVKMMVPKGSMLYLITDGIIDQSNSERKRFGQRRLIELFKENSHLPLKEQRQQIEKALDEYQGNEEQRDDITVLGVKL